MKGSFTPFVLLGSISCFTLLAVSEKDPWQPLQAKLPVRISGYIKWEGFADSRQVVGFRDDQVLYYPKPKDCDPYCQDINAHRQFQMAAFQTKLRLEADGPSISHAQTLGVVEGDFYGRDHIANIFRLRFAYLQLAWDKVKLLGGQYWHPLYIVGADARSISFNSGSPIDPYARNPQLRIIANTASQKIEFLFTAISEVESPSDGPIGESTTYMRHAVVPELDAQIKVLWHQHIAGIGFDYKRIVPRLETNKGIKAHESLNSLAAIAYASFTWKPVSTRFKFTVAQNPTDFSMIGGYAVHCVDSTDDHREYTNLTTISCWNDTQFNYHDKFIPGWFVGIVKNLGSHTTILQNVTDDEGTITDRRIFGFGTDIDYVLRISPRLAWQADNFMFAAEFEYTRAAYGTINDKGKVINTDPVGNFRILLALFYYL